MGYIVSKFGGWANADSGRVKIAADLFEMKPDRKIKVNSAIGKIKDLPKVTDLLSDGAEATIKKGVFPEDLIEKIRLNHYYVFEPLGISKKKIDEVINILYDYIKMKKELSDDHFRALMMGAGEELFSRLDTVYLKEIRGFNAKYVDPRDIGHYLMGHPLDGKVTKEAEENLKKLLDIEGIIVYPGFFAIDKKNRPMIYSRGGTDKTAADVSVAIGASVYENWKEVDGVYSADPRVVKNPVLMEEVTYKEIRELTYISFNVLHQEAMLPVMNAGIPINLRNLTNLEHKGTFIVNERKINLDRPVIGIAHIENVCFINIEKCLMNEEIGFANNLLKIFEEHRISIDQITTGIDSMCLIVSEKEFKEKTVHSGVSEQIRREIEPEEFMRWLKENLDADLVQIRKKKGLICVVGEGMRHTIGLLSRISVALSKNGVNIEIIDQGPSERNIIIGVDLEDDKQLAKKVVNIIYNEFF
ncbi:MAG: aspartate kinase [Spirochaetes bacterium]|nr:aspartate kinase [Spirochaetota bacterium]